MTATPRSPAETLSPAELTACGLSAADPCHRNFAMTEYVPCPTCSSTNVQKVSFTWWGGVLGPSLFTQVKCRDCGATFNGKTGKSNAGPIAIYVVITAILAVAVVIFVRRL